MNRNKQIQRAALMVVILTACCVMPAMAAGITVNLPNIMLRPMSLWELLIRCFHALFGVAMY